MVNWRVLEQNLPYVWEGFQNTLGMAGVSILLALLVGVLGGMAMTAHSRWLTLPVRVYVIAIRSTPLLVQLYFIFFGLPTVGITLTESGSGILALTLNSGAYIVEIVRAGLGSVSRGQHEAAIALGLTYWQRMRYVVLPQAFRVILQPLVGQFMYLIKDTSILSVIGVFDLTRAADYISSRTFRPVEAYLPSTILYLCLSFALMYAANVVGNRFSNRPKRPQGPDSTILREEAAT